jgi:hypothetical protein
MHAEDMIPTFLMWIIDIAICIPKALTQIRLQSYEMFEVLPIVRINFSVGLWTIINFRLLTFEIWYRLARGIPFTKGVPYPLQSKVRAPPPHLH